MLPKVNRLKKNKEFERVFKKGQSFREAFLILKVVVSSFKNSRFGFIVSKKVSKKSSLRNKIKRRLRGLVRARLKKITRNTDNLLIAAPGLETKDFQEMEKTVDKLFKKAKIVE